MSGAALRKYQQRRPETTVLYRIIQEHLESFLTHAHERSGTRLPKYVENEFRRYLECGIHAHGFARAVCEACGDELLLPFSCKRRSICVSCNTRRMSNTAAHLVDRVIAPDLTLRQWVLTVPFELRLLLAAKPDALSAIGRLFVQEIQRWQRQQAEALRLEQAEGAAVSFCQRFGSSLNLNIHWHVIVPDALFVPDAGNERVQTLKHRAPRRLDLEEIVTGVAVRAVRWLAQHGYLHENGSDQLGGSSEAESPWLRCLRGSLGVGELQRWTEHQRLDEGSEPARSTRSPPRPSKGLGAQYLRFNLHAGVSIPRGLPAARERLLHYCARPPLALERLSVLDDGRICYRIKDTEQVRLMTPMQFMGRLAALVPPPRYPLVRYYGAWAPHSQWRSRVVPAAPPPTLPACTEPSALPPLPCPPAERLSVAVTASRSETASPPDTHADLDVRAKPRELDARHPVGGGHADRRVCAARPTPRGRRAALRPPVAAGLGQALSEGLRHRPSGVPALRWAHALRPSDRRRDQRAQRAAPSEPPG